MLRAPSLPGGRTRVYPRPTEENEMPTRTSRDQGTETTINPVRQLMTLCDQGANREELCTAMNRTYAVTKYGTKIVVASIVGKDMEIMDVAEFDKMFANMVIDEGKKAIKVSKCWFAWKGRRQ
jgi:hypothetical protein